MTTTRDRMDAPVRRALTRRRFAKTMIAAPGLLAVSACGDREGGETDGAPSNDAMTGGSGWAGYDDAVVIDALASPGAVQRAGPDRAATHRRDGAERGRFRDYGRERHGERRRGRSRRGLRSDARAPGLLAARGRGAPRRAGHGGERGRDRGREGGGQAGADHGLSGHLHAGHGPGPHGRVPGDGGADRPAHLQPPQPGLARGACRPETEA